MASAVPVGKDVSETFTWVGVVGEGDRRPVETDEKRSMADGAVVATRLAAD